MFVPQTAINGYYSEFRRYENSRRIAEKPKRSRKNTAKKCRRIPRHPGNRDAPTRRAQPNPATDTLASSPHCSKARMCAFLRMGARRLITEGRSELLGILVLPQRYMHRYSPCSPLTPPKHTICSMSSIAMCRDRRETASCTTGRAKQWSRTTGRSKSQQD